MLPELRSSWTWEPTSHSLRTTSSRAQPPYQLLSENTTRLSPDYKTRPLSISGRGRVSDGEVALKYGYTLLYWADTLEPGVVPLERSNDASPRS